jgi:hypothetical protein
MRKYTRKVGKNMRKNRRGRSRRGGYWFYPGPGDDTHSVKSFWPFGSSSKSEEAPVPEPELPPPPLEEQPEVQSEYSSYPDQEPGSLEYAPAREKRAEDETIENAEQEGGRRRRRRRRVTTKRKRSNKSRRTNKRRRSNKRRR